MVASHLDWELNRLPSDSQARASSTELRQPGQGRTFLIESFIEIFVDAPAVVRNNRESVLHLAQSPPIRLYFAK